MKRYLKAAVYATALLLGSVSADAVLSAASAQADGYVSFDSFHQQLAPYGDWVYSDRWGEVWIPGDVPQDFHPYGTGGRWVYTDEYGWTWDSDYEWGDIPFHYGRWVNDPDDGWLWIPGYVWSPGWVVWRHNGRYTGWMPMPPDEQFLGRRPGTSIGISIGGLSISFDNTDDDYGYSRWYGRDYGPDRFASNWIFIGTGHMADRDYRRYEAPRDNYTTIIHNTTNITNYTVVNNYIVNKSVDPNAVRKAGGRVQAVQIANVVKRPQFITRADTGSQLQARMRSERPHGTGLANSAPKPTAMQIQSLSTKAPRTRGGKPPAHLFTRDTVTKAPLVERPGISAPVAAPKPLSPAERKDIRHGILPTIQAPATKPVINPPPAMIKREPVMMAPPKKVAPLTPAKTLREKKVPGRVIAPDNISAPAATPREHIRPMTQTTPVPKVPVETRSFPRRVPVTTAPAVTVRPVVPVRHPAAVVERPKPPVEVHVPVAPKAKKVPPKRPNGDKPDQQR